MRIERVCAPTPFARDSSAVRANPERILNSGIVTVDTSHFSVPFAERHAAEAMCCCSCLTLFAAHLYLRRSFHRNGVDAQLAFTPVLLAAIASTATLITVAAAPSRWDGPLGTRSAFLLSLFFLALPTLSGDRDWIARIGKSNVDRVSEKVTELKDHLEAVATNPVVDAPTARSAIAEAFGILDRKPPSYHDRAFVNNILERTSALRHNLDVATKLCAGAGPSPTSDLAWFEPTRLATLKSLEELKESLIKYEEGDSQNGN